MFEFDLEAVDAVEEAKKGVFLARSKAAAYKDGLDKFGRAWFEIDFDLFDLHDNLKQYKHRNFFTVINHGNEKMADLGKQSLKQMLVAAQAPSLKITSEADLQELCFVAHVDQNTSQKTQKTYTNIMRFVQLEPDQKNALRQKLLELYPLATAETTQTTDDEEFPF